MLGWLLLWFQGDEAAVKVREVKQIKQKPRAQTPGVSVNRIGYTVTPIVFPATHVVKHYGWISSRRFTPFDTNHVRRKERSERGDVGHKRAGSWPAESESLELRFYTLF